MPLPEAWAREYAPGTGNFAWRDRVLAYWIEMSERDPWTFDDVGDLLAAMLDSGEDVPPRLDAWAREVASRRRSRPTPSGRRRADRSEDARIVLLLVMYTRLFGDSRREACRIIGRGLHKSPEAIESAWRRYHETV